MTKDKEEQEVQTLFKRAPRSARKRHDKSPATRLRCQREMTETLKETAKKAIA